MDELITLNDGTVSEGYFIVSDNRLFVYMKNISLSDAFAALIDPEKTSVISENRYGEVSTVQGYNHLYAITEESETMVSAVLRKS